MVELTMEFENKFEIRLPDDVVEGVHTVQDAEDLIKQTTLKYKL